MNIFNQPFPCTTSIRTRFFSALGFGIFVFAFLLIFKPFGINTLPWNRQLILCGTYGAVTFGVLFGLSTTILLLTPGMVRDETWTTGKEILYITGYVIMVGLANYLVSRFLFDGPRDWRNIFWFQVRTGAVAVLPISFYVLLKQNFLLNRFKKEAENLQKRLDEKNRGGGGQEPPSPASDPEPLPPTPPTSSGSGITLTGDYQNEKISVAPDHLYFISSASNYVKVYFGQHEKVTYSIIRMTMKKAEESLEGHSCFFRCHRAYIINLDKVIHVVGNAQGYKVQISGSHELIPVSRNLNNEFSDRLLASRSIVV